MTTNDSITIKNADMLQYQVLIKEGVIHFGKEVGINLNCLISYQFEEAKEDETKKNTVDMVEDIKEKYKYLIDYTGFACNSDLEILSVEPNVCKLAYGVTFRYKKDVLNFMIRIPANVFGNMDEVNTKNRYIREKIVEYLVKENKI